ncbi:hypothetical protein AB6A40_008252 [Gnathostoma spinigerum]|uniref:Uncharacterized protein n=1 Tax=Gnathostoma spinigerum TaxID=75299 RepID=A0ABD6ENU8_9BILA
MPRLTVQGLLAALEIPMHAITRSRSKMPPEVHFGSTLIFELHNRSSHPYLKVLYVDDLESGHFINVVHDIPVCSPAEDQMCSFERFRKLAKYCPKGELYCREK